MAGNKRDYLLDLDKSLAYMQGGELTGLTIRAVAGGWRCTLKRKHAAGHEIAFLVCTTFSDLLLSIAEQTERGTWKFYKDKYPPGR